MEVWFEIICEHAHNFYFYLYLAEQLVEVYQWSVGSDGPLVEWVGNRFRK